MRFSNHQLFSFFGLCVFGFLSQPNVVAAEENKIPNWYLDGVMYQIFPDRFFDGNPGNNIKTNEYTYAGSPAVQKSWGDSPIVAKGESPAFTFYGGDLDGIREKLGYIKETLGADIVYLNPVFESPSNHKYDTTDYDHVAKCLGGDDALNKLSSAIHSKEGKAGYLVLDAVFNHTGDGHKWFHKYNFAQAPSETKGAYESQSSPYYSYYTFSKWPQKYATFLDVDSLPKLNFGSEAVKDLIYRKPDSVAQRYLKAPMKIDGWRVDAPQYIDENGKQGLDKFNHAIWQDFRSSVKACSPNSIILGEFWHDASKWTNSGKEWDTVTNFAGFTKPVSEWICGVDFDGKAVKMSASGFDRSLRKTRELYTPAVQQALSNHLSNHDISRFAERAGGDKRKSKLAFLFQMSYIGVPLIYYGDEYGMQGGKDPDCRRTFDWKKVEEKDPLIDYVHKLIQLRSNYSALRSGSFITLLTDDTKNIYSYGRSNDSAKIAVVLNGSDKEQDTKIAVSKLDFPNETQIKDELNNKEYTVKDGMVSLHLDAFSGAMLVLPKEKFQTK